VLFGGVTEYNEKLNDTWKFNTESGEWTEVGIQQIDAPLARCGHSANVYNNRFMLIFGGTYKSKHEMNDIHAFDLNSNSWVLLYNNVVHELERPPQEYKPGSTSRS